MKKQWKIRNNRRIKMNEENNGRIINNEIMNNGRIIINERNNGRIINNGRSETTSGNF
jgi:hypothetical protein